MPISIKNDETEKLAREVAELTGESITEGIRVALMERRDRLSQDTREKRLARLLAIAERCASLPRLSDRSEDDILGYDENGIPEQPWSSTPRRS